MGFFAGAFLAGLALAVALLALRVLAARGLVLALGSAAVVLAVLRTLGFLAGVAAGASWLASSEAVRLETLAPPSLTRTGFSPQISSKR